MVEKNITSFINERTLEYKLVPDLQKALEPHCNAAMPMFFWKTREGGIRSRASFPGESFKVIAMFARRPKVHDKSNALYATINDELLIFAEHAINMGVPTLGGFCAARNLGEITSAHSIWIPLFKSDESMNLLRWNESDSPGGSLSTYESKVASINTGELPEAILPRCEPMSFGTAIDTMDRLRSVLNREAVLPYYYGSSYKPVYMLTQGSRL